MSFNILQISLKNVGQPLSSKFLSHRSVGIIIAAKSNIVSNANTRKLSTTTPKATKNYVNNKLIETGPKLDALAESLSSKGYLRSQKSYQPPSDVVEQIDQIIVQTNISTKTGAKNNKGKSEKFSLNVDDKFLVLNKCYQQFNHSVPNSKLHEINSIDDIIEFYVTPVNTTLPLDALKTMDLPRNLHIQTDYVRFNDETNGMFKGHTAFPKSSTLVTGLKYRKKYQGYEVKRSWP